MGLEDLNSDVLFLIQEQIDEVGIPWYVATSAIICMKGHIGMVIGEDLQKLKLVRDCHENYGILAYEWRLDMDVMHDMIVDYSDLILCKISK